MIVDVVVFAVLAVIAAFVVWDLVRLARRRRDYL